jgi:hypothetical protein
MSSTRMRRGATCGLAGLALGLAAVAVPAVAQAGQASRARLEGARAESAMLPQVSYRWTVSKITWTGSRKVVAATDSHHDLYAFWEAASSGTWHKQLVAKGGSSSGYSAPSIAWTGHAVAIAALDHAGDLVYFSQHSGSTKWSHQTVAKASGMAYIAPSIAAAGNGTVLISAAKKGGFLRSFALAAGSSTWTKLGVGAAGHFASSSITTCYDGLVHAYLGLITATVGGTLYFWWERLDTPGWNQQVIVFSNATTSYTGGSIAATGSALLITAATKTGAVDLWWQTIGGSTWNQQTVAAAGGTKSTNYNNPAVTWTGPVLGGSNSYDVVTATTWNGALDYWWKLDGGGSTWHLETVAKAGQKASYANPSFAANSKSVNITAINTKPGDVDFWFQPYQTNPWHKQTVAKG